MAFIGDVPPPDQVTAPASSRPTEPVVAGSDHIDHVEKRIVRIGRWRECALHHQLGRQATGRVQEIEGGDVGKSVGNGIDQIDELALVQ